MNEIKIELVSDSDDVLWQKYFDLCQEISRKYYKKGYEPDKTLEKFRESIRSNSPNLSVREDFVVFYSGLPAARFDFSIVKNDLYFSFDVNSDTVPEEILNAVLSKVRESMQKYSCPEAMNYVFRGQIADIFRNIQAEVNEEILVSRLDRENMDESFYKQITNNEDLNSWKIEFYDEIPEKLLPQFIEFTKVIIDDIASRNPYTPKMYPFTIESWKKNIKNFGNSMTSCFMFDNEGNIAGLCWVLSYPEFRSAVQHNGGLTAVDHKYRRKGIAKFLKAKLYLKLLNENKDFKYITTDTMPWNKYMYRINEEFGFKPYRKGTSFKLTKDFLENYLNLK